MGEWDGKGLCEVISQRQKRKMMASYRSQMWAVAFSDFIEEIKKSISFC